MSDSQLKKRKKQKVSGKEILTELLESPINPTLFTADVIQHYTDSHTNSQPYKHVVIKDLCVDSRMRLVHAEIKNNMKANFKETDLFKVFQTGDLSALDSELISKMPNLMSLRQSIYSPEFRDMVSRMTGINDLTDRVDCSANAYANSCHLLCHDDVIGTRRVSYIIYLTDPDDPWLATDGGAVELYPVTPESIVDRGEELGGKQGVPAAAPTTSLLPLYNTMLFFTVQPGRSYHSVQEVYSKDKPRLSISGWYHGPDAPKGADKASLQQIMTKGDDLRPFSLFLDENNTPVDSVVPTEEEEDEDEEVELTASDKLYLSRWINPTYLRDDMLEEINEQFCENSSLQLMDFLRTDVAMRVIRGFMAQDSTEDVGHGQPQLDYSLGSDKDSATEGWQLVGPPHKRRYMQYQTNDEDLSSSSGAQDDALFPVEIKKKKTKGKDKKGKDQKEKAKESSVSKVEPESIVDAGKLLNIIRRRLFRSTIFAKYLHKVTALRPVGYKDEVRRFRAGLDYTVAHYGVLTKIPRLDATLCFVNASKELEKEVLGSNHISETKGAFVSGDDDENDEDEDADQGDYYENLWDSGDVGGFECYIEAEEDPENAEAAEVYRGGDKHDNQTGEEKEDSLLSVSPGNNVLSLVMRDEGIMKFIKYVSANAPSSRWDITSEYEIIIKEGDADDDSSDEGDDESEENGDEEQEK